ncbi:bifunctional [glutamine synthetase] adenylyltransferase/[glutamine synthetase]-adenylyl-L-tyrosine phosphorylase [Sphingomonas sp. CFBP 13720]|uniref:bifunctional [glutamine synthetase] adenylyltransferase/[glutamine synthetase]-adenylyl-L-tyrosine phosphorylase n=1 Tax=Sphingomonas sp. CFBP 13720 TaxID=2775302 RepID=UPI001784C7B3|nr:bifunctional [glutamine synthetase] adenylyltransferase/[glutamine synthetase]-adenylyl-L-tyrosine phosphorylase [Sphingomonas sp. CFBP 13720]MBD8677328.1 bifunctional [glutamine synthetase] adenylyltransferase/[glutamine synthetase]-adenylyl-L-tyrosine phosphorylase [Sphingomonas sp. CFBP 13720]
MRLDSELLARVRDGSPFLSTLVDREGDFLDRLTGFDVDALAVIALEDPDVPLARRLRIERRRLALLVALGDLGGAYDLRRVTRTLSDFADHALDRAIAAAIEERTPGAAPIGFTAIALGKQGSRELNYSSDIDPILLYDPAILPRRERDDPAEAAVRIARRATELLQARDGDGYVLRVDLRLRPSSEVTPIALPVDAAIGYYESAALPWERAAFIRARAAAGDTALGERFLDAIRPFVWRRALDFGAIGEIRDITRRIRDHYAQGQAFGPGYDLKRGRGGIREAEFFAQVHQLVHGGRDPRLRVPATLDALEALAAAGRIAADEATTMASGYTLFRTIEHRLQMVDDRQTHSLPAKGEAIDRVARLHGVADGDALLALLAPHVAAVAGVYDRLDGAATPRLPADPRLLAGRLAALGFDPPDAAVRRIADWRGGAYPALRSPAARSALEDSLPGVIAGLAAASDHDAALLRLDAMLAKLPSAINLFRLLEAQPALAKLLSTILCHAPTLADALARRASLLDALIDARALEPVGSVAELAAEMRMRSGEGYERLLDHVRDVVNEKRFMLGVQVVAGTGDPLAVAAGYARLAEAAVEVLARATADAFAERHGRVPDSELVVLALGRLGGGALTHASDLDLIYCFTGDFAAESDGDKPLGAVLYYNRLAQRLTAALSVQTASGPLYEVDTRLRPSGAQGPLVVSLTGFERYQREDAWTWEHMALARARPIVGSAAARERAAAIIARVLAGDRPVRDVTTEAVAMRAEMARHKPSAGPLDAKLGEGGLVDLEFAVHVLQLRERTAFSPHLGEAVDLLIACGLLPEAMRDAHDFLTRLIVAVRLIAPGAQLPPDTTQPILAAAVGCGDWAEVMATLDTTRHDVRTAWADVMEGRYDGNR